MAETIPPEMGGTKLNRAREHLEDLNRRLGTFMETHGQAFDPVITHCDEETGETIIEFPRVDPPIEFAAVIGDCVQNFRSALDHAVHELARRRKSDDWLGLRSMEFPIIQSAEAYRKQHRGKIGALSAPHRTFIENVQPYQRGNGDATQLDAIREALGHLQQLSVIDKHGRIHTLTMGIPQIGVGVSNDPDWTPEIPPEAKTARNVRLRERSESENAMDVSFAVGFAVFFDEQSVGRVRAGSILRPIENAVLNVLAKLNRIPDSRGI